MAQEFKAAAQARFEAEKTGLLNAVPDPQSQMDSMRRALADANQEREERRNRDRTALFVKAAYRTVDRATFDAIWAKAKELFPDSPAWAELPGDDE
jgi:hypothetical protein